MSLTGIEIVDVHMHIGELGDTLSWYDGKGPGQLGAPWDMDEDIKSRVRAMDAAGCDWAVIQPSHGYLRPDGIRDTMRVNDTIAAFRAKKPDRFPVACGVVEPMHGERSLAELERIKYELKLDGIAWHHRFQGCTIDSRWMWRILEKMGELGLVPVMHTNAESYFEPAWQLQRLAQAFPDMDFLALDAFYAYERGNQVLASAKSSPNIVWDLGGIVSYVSPDMWVSINDSRTIAFSGVAAYPIPAGVVPKRPRMLDQLENSRMSREDKANILGGNIRRVFRMPPEG